MILVNDPLQYRICGPCARPQCSIFSSMLCLYCELKHTRSSFAGTSPGAIDVTDFVNVGVATYAVTSGLSLQSGITYYATIRAFDFVGQYANGFSQAVTVDTSPPIVKRVWIEGANDCFGNELNLMWDIPSDVESGIAGMEWGLGTRPGSSDVVEWNGVDVTLDVTGVSVDKTRFDDGQVLFLTLKVRIGLFHVCLWVCRSIALIEVVLYNNLVTHTHTHTHTQNTIPTHTHPTHTHTLHVHCVTYTNTYFS